MRAICIDDEELVLKLHTVDLAILDIDMPEMNGIGIILQVRYQN